MYVRAWADRNPCETNWIILKAINHLYMNEWETGSYMKGEKIFIWSFFRNWGVKFSRKCWPWRSHIPLAKLYLNQIRTLCFSFNNQKLKRKIDRKTLFFCSWLKSTCFWYIFAFSSKRVLSSVFHCFPQSYILSNRKLLTKIFICRSSAMFLFNAF